VEYTAEQKQEIIDALKWAAVAYAAYWDTLRAIEIAHDCEIETSPELVGSLASNCNIPPNANDLDDNDVWESFEADAKVKQL
jgi:hypothetical protein